MSQEPEHPVTKLLSELKLTIAQQVGGRLDATQELIIEKMAEAVNESREHILDQQRDGDNFLFVFKDMSYIEFNFYKDKEGNARVEYNVGMTTIKDGHKH